MEPLDSILPRVIEGIPAPERLVRVCEKHGVLLPKAMHGRWVIRTCPCDDLRREQEARLHIHEVLRQHRMRRTYTWLGEQWSDLDLAAKTFANFVASKAELPYLQVQEWVADPRGNLILYGSYGLGKTHLLAATANELGSLGTAVLFATAFKFFDAIKASFGEGGPTQIITEAKRAPLLILDDVDKVRPTEWTLPIWHDLIDDRVNRRLPTALSTNKFGELHVYLGDSVRDRLRVGAVEIEFLGESYRREL